MNMLFDQNMLKNMEKLMKGFPMQSQPMFDFGKIKKILIIVGLSVFLSGFGVGLLVGLLF